MYNKSVDSAKVIFLLVYSNYVSELSRILEENPKRKDKNLAIIAYLKKMKAKGALSKELTESCNQYLANEMNDTCLALVVSEERSKIRKEQQELREEKIFLTKIIKEADQITITKCFDIDKKIALKQLVDGKQLEHLKLEFNEIVNIISKVSSEEISPVEANRELQNVASHLRFLGEYLKI